jgi:hypothetical protein
MVFLPLLFCPCSASAIFCPFSAPPLIWYKDFFCPYSAPFYLVIERVSASAFSAPVLPLPLFCPLLFGYKMVFLPLFCPCSAPLPLSASSKKKKKVWYCSNIKFSQSNELFYFISLFF